MKSRTKESLSEEETRQSLIRVLRDGITTQIMLTLTSGVFLISFALDLGANSIIIGFIIAIPFLAQLIQIPAIYLIEKYQVRRRINIIATSLSRFFLLPMIFVPVLYSIELAIPTLLVLIALHYSIGAIGNCSWDSWMRDLIPEEVMGHFFSRRMTWAMGFGIVVALIAGLFLDYWRATSPSTLLYAYSILFLGGFIVGMIGVGIVSLIFEPQMKIKPVISRNNYTRIFLTPFGDINFKHLILFLFTWNFFINLATPFFTVYLINILKLDLSLIIIFQMMSQLVNVFFFRIWGNIIDKFSNKSVLLISCPLLLFSIFLWIFTPLIKVRLVLIALLILIYLFIGISIAGINLATANIGLKLAPRGNATSYLAVRNIVIAFASGIAPLLAGIIDEGLTTLKFSFWIFNSFDILFLLAALLGSTTLFFLTNIQEVGEVDEKIVIQEVFIEMKKFFRVLPISIGFKQMTNISSSILKNYQQIKRIEKEKISK